MGGVGSGERFLKASLRQSGDACGVAFIGTPEGVPFRGGYFVGALEGVTFCAEISLEHMKGSVPLGYFAGTYEGVPFRREISLACFEGVSIGSFVGTMEGLRFGASLSVVL
jgi:hypothetical protein